MAIQFYSQSSRCVNNKMTMIYQEVIEICNCMARGGGMWQAEILRVCQDKICQTTLKRIPHTHYTSFTHRDLKTQLRLNEAAEGLQVEWGYGGSYRGCGRWKHAKQYEIY